MEGPSLKLKIEKGPREGETLEFEPPSAVRIGRIVRGNTFSIKDSGISSKHLSIDFSAGKWVVKDLDSSNGTFLNGTELSPLTPFDLRDGDVVKIGEFTSILVSVVDGGRGGDTKPPLLRKNPRRGAAAAEGNVPPAAENRSRRAGTRASKKENTGAGDVSLGLDEENAKLGFDGNVGPVVENWGRRVGTRALKEQDLDTGIGDLGFDGENGNVGVGVGGALKNPSLRRGRPKKARALKDEEVEHVGPVEEKPNQLISPRRTRSSKNQQRFEQIPENSSFIQDGCKEVENLAPVAGRRNRASTRKKKKNTKDESLEEVKIDALNDKENVKNWPLEEVEIHEFNDKENAERERCKESTSGQKDTNGRHDGVPVLVPDLEKMTLGEWFDHLEVALPQQIRAETEKMIEVMKQRAAQVSEYVAMTKNENGKMPIIG